MAERKYSPSGGAAMPESPVSGLGKARLLADYGRESAYEQRRYENQLIQAERAAEDESRGKGAWGLGGSFIGALTSIASGGDPRDGWKYGGEAGTHAYNLFGSDYDPRQYALSTDMGTFNVSERLTVEDVNRRFEEAHKVQGRKDLVATGKVLASSIFDVPDEEDKGKSLWDKLQKPKISDVDNVGSFASADNLDDVLSSSEWLNYKDRTDLGTYERSFGLTDLFSSLDVNVSDFSSGNSGSSISSFSWDPMG
tara:strand:- start:2166 stop:2924 length:759 start_codon:yes stop_codon:yes gene_type:complete